VCILAYKQPITTVYSELRTNEKGLSSSEATARLQQHGENRIQEEQRQSAFVTLVSQFSSIPVLLLALAAVASAFLGEWHEAIAIAAILLINAIIGFVQERKAGDAIAALRKLTALKVKVLRDGQKQLLDATQLVPGDIIYLETGDKVPADARIVEVYNAAALESSLTGESTPVNKTSAQLTGTLPLGDQRNMVFSGTVITAGRITAVVTATGMHTELGKVAGMLSAVDETDSPLKQKVDHMVKNLSIIVLCMAVTIFFVLLYLRPAAEDPLFSALITAVAMAVAALPEGLPIILTITSAIGIKRMVKRHVLIRRLMSVETLGSVSVICTDKTGTLTKNEMTVQQIYVNGAVYDVSGQGYDFKGAVNAPLSRELNELLLCGALCNNASIAGDNVTGDPTELALIVSAAKAGKHKPILEQMYQRVAEKEFTSERKLMSTVYTKDGKRIQYVKGAPDILLKNCRYILEKGKRRAITPRDRKRILAAVDTFSNRALRVLACASRTPSKTLEETSLTFIGLQAMMDPPREEVKGAIEKCTLAGIKVVMITGDHPATAAAVASALGISGRVVTGEELDRMSNLDAEVEFIAIYARVNPEHKLRIVSALQHRGHVVAMTGDGVNDAPALKKADIGVAMGITGTDVAKEASQMIITDDNFSSIVNAVEEGRSIYDNIQRFVRYQLSTNVGAMLLLITTILLAIPLPLLPLQLLWINLSIDGPPALSLGLEPKHDNVLKRKPRARSESIIHRRLFAQVLLGGVIMAAGTLSVFLYFYMRNPLAYTYATTMAFTTFACFQFFNVLNCRSLHESVFSIGFFSNRFAIITIAITAFLHALLLYVPFFQEVFHTYPLSLFDWIVCICVASSILLFYEAKKLLIYHPH
jgi:P-type Ca2+ transporter type 2C